MELQSLLEPSKCLNRSNGSGIVCFEPVIVPNCMKVPETNGEDYEGSQKRFAISCRPSCCANYQ